MRTEYRFGILAAGSTLVIYTLTYLISKRLMLGPLTHWLSLFAVVVFMVMACRTERDATEKTYPFKIALRTAFLVFLFNTIIFHVFYFFLLGILDPSLLDLQKEMSIEQTKWLSENVFQIDPDDPAFQGLENMDNKLTLGSLFVALGQSIIGGFIIAVIIALFFKRDFNLDGSGAAPKM